jgi:hypothetical protein
MSATFNVQRFAEYFSFPLYGKLIPAPIIDLEKSHDQKTSFMIHEYYLCQLRLLGLVSSLHVCKLEWQSVSHFYMRQFYVIRESCWSHLVGGIVREELCVQMCFEASYFHESRLYSFYSPIRAHSSNKTGFPCFSAAPLLPVMSLLVW